MLVCVRVCVRVCLVCHYINSHKHNALKIGAKLANYSGGKEQLRMRGVKRKREGERERESKSKSKQRRPSTFSVLALKLSY